MTTTLQFSLELPWSTAVVWASLTSADALSEWIMPNDFEPIVGRSFFFRPEVGAPITCRVTDLDPDRLLAYLWDDGSSPTPSLVVWRISPIKGGVRLELEHRHLDDLPVTRLELGANWSASLGRLVHAVPVPTVWMSEEEENDTNRRRAGFRQPADPAGVCA